MKLSWTAGLLVCLAIGAIVTVDASEYRDSIRETRKLLQGNSVSVRATASNTGGGTEQTATVTVQGQGRGAATSTVNGNTISVARDEPGTESVSSSSPSTPAPTPASPTAVATDTCQNGENLPNNGQGEKSEEFCCRCPADNKCTGHCACDTGACVDSVPEGTQPLLFPENSDCNNVDKSKFWWCEN